MKLLTIIIAGSLVLHATTLSAQQQNLTGPEQSDSYIQHKVIKKGDVFVFNNQNTNKRVDIAQFDNTTKTGNFPSFKMTYPARKQEFFFFRLRHPIAIEPYTEYELSFSYQASDIQGQGPYLEIAVYDETRETLVESHKAVITGNQSEWKQQVFKFTTKNKGRFARLLMKSSSGGSGNVLVNDISLKQLSDPQATRPKEIKIWEKTGLDIAKGMFASPVAKLPVDKIYYSFTLNMKWENFLGSVPLKIEWLTDEKVIVTDRIEISALEGLQPKWNGVQSDWKREQGNSVDLVSRQKESIFNADAKGGTGVMVFKLDRPQDATSMRISADKSKVDKGNIEIQRAVMSAEY